MVKCPRDNANLQTVVRHGIEIDICPTCQGIWLDRGELEKLIEAEKDLNTSPTTEPIGTHKTHTNKSRRLIQDLFDKLE